MALWWHLRRACPGNHQDWSWCRGGVALLHYYYEVLVLLLVQVLTLELALLLHRWEGPDGRVTPRSMVKQEGGLSKKKN